MEIQERAPSWSKRIAKAAARLRIRITTLQRQLLFVSTELVIGYQKQFLTRDLVLLRLSGREGV